MTNIANNVHQQSTSTGTGDLTLTTVTGRQSFEDAFGTGGTDAFYYFIRNRNADEWEVGTGHLSSSLLVRDTVIESSNVVSGVAVEVDFSSGTKDVSNDLPARELVGHVVWPELFGAAGDGSTDDGAALALAAAAADAANIPLLLLNEYAITSTFAVDDHLHLQGHGSIIAAAALDVAVEVGANDLFWGTMRDIVIRKENYSATPSNNTGLRIVDAAEAIFDHVEVNRFDIDVDMVPASGQRVAYCTFSNPAWEHARITCRIQPSETGFVAENTWFAGRFRAPSGGPLEYQLYMENLGTAAMNHNRFINVSMEASNTSLPDAIACIRLVNGNYNYFENVRTESTNWPGHHIILDSDAIRNFIVLSRNDTTVKDDGDENVIVRRGMTRVQAGSTPVDFSADTPNGGNSFVASPASHVVTRATRNYNTTAGATSLIVGGNEGSSQVAFGDIDNLFSGRVEYDHNADWMRFWVDSTEIFQIRSTAIRPNADDTIALGAGPGRWSEVFAATGTINTSDEREKNNLGPIPDAVLDAWSDVEFVHYQWLTAIEKKGEAARKHIGVLAQRIDEAFKRHGLDAREWGLFCYDEWDDEYERAEDEHGDKAGEPILKTPAGNRYGIRADQCLFLEAALTRRRMDRLEGASRS